MSGPAPDPRPKIVGIGLNKTGTSSLHEALQHLGFPSVHFQDPQGMLDRRIEANHLRGLPVLSGLEHYQAFTDWNNGRTNGLFVEIDLQYPGTRFILTTRDLEAWLDSRERHVRRNAEDPGYTGAWTRVDRDAWRQERRVHHERVLSYFESRPYDLLVMDIPAGDGWERLCPFLGVPEPSAPFPHANPATRPDSPLRRLARRLARRS